MASAQASLIDPGALQSFQEHLTTSKRILALVGAGLSASSGLPTFRGAGGLWRTHEATALATPEAFDANPGLVWQFYSYRRHMAVNVKPNPAHYALAELSRRKPDFLTLSQNVDGLSQRANHPPQQLKLLHGTLFNVKCSQPGCRHIETNYVDPIVPALAIPSGEVDPTSNESRKAVAEAGNQLDRRELDISNIAVEIPRLSRDDLMNGGLRCPTCQQGMLRPGVVWFGEALPHDVLTDIDVFLRGPKDLPIEDPSVDLIMVIGTSAKVYPAAGYVDKARRRGARVAVINMDVSDEPRSGMNEGDWFFQGDAAVLVPKLLENVIGELPPPTDRLAEFAAAG